MKKAFLLVVFVIAFMIPSSGAAGNLIGTWQLNLSASDFGSDPPPKSITLTILEDSKARLGYRVHRINSHGDFNYAWRGTKDGTPSATVVSGVSSTNSLEANKEVNGEIVGHGIERDGTLVVTRVSVAPDGHSITLNNTWIQFDGTEVKQKWVFDKAK